ncbi:MAG: hypothetical protein OEZ06_07040 [Myxococcales bacterium]|nr:hypothetical protein [Myxococcales bacterium]
MRRVAARGRFGRLGLLLGLSLVSLALSGCELFERCGVPGVVLQCDCGSLGQGARVCGEDRRWGPCDCATAIALPREITSTKPDAGGADDMSSAGSDRGSSTRPPPTGGGTSDDDGGVDAVGGTGGGTSSTGGTGGSGGVVQAGSGGAGGEPAVVEDPYRPCAATADCGDASECVITPGFPANASVCAPTCVDAGDCTMPAGSYDATVVCDAGYCKLDCTPVLFAPLLSCPEGMVCIAPLLGISHCHDDGI